MEKTAGVYLPRPQRIISLIFQNSFMSNAEIFYDNFMGLRFFTCAP